MILKVCRYFINLRWYHHVMIIVTILVPLILSSRFGYPTASSCG